jgi:hypothetical protein
MRIKSSLFSLVFAISLTTLSAPILVNAQESARRDVRFYKVNGQIQPTRIRFTAKKAVLAGCHNFVKRTRIHRAVQIGYSSCRLYADKDCAALSIVAVSRETDDLQAEDLEADEAPIEKATSNTLSEGVGWYPVSEHRRGVKLRSWSCSLTAPHEDAAAAKVTRPDLADPNSVDLQLPKLGG